MPESHNDRVIRLLKKDKKQRDYIREYMKKYRETHKPAKIYHSNEQIRLLMQQSRYRTDAIKFIRFLF